MLEDNLKPLGLDRLGAVRPRISAANASLREQLLDDGGSVRELPALPDLITALSALAKGSRRKLILPLSGEPAEFAFVRSGTRVRIDCYGTESAPEIFVRGREVELAPLLSLCVQATLDAADEQPEATAAALRKLARKLADTRLRPDPQPRLSPLSCSGGSLDSPGDKVALAFGFNAEVMPGLDPQPESHAFADVHALLFDGSLWAFAGEKRVALFEGPIMLAAQCMVAAVRVLCDAGQADRTVHRRLRSAGFWVAVRGDRSGPVQLTFGGDRRQAVTWPALSFVQATLPILRLGSDLIRKLIAVDRRQTQNLRVVALRAEIRALRKLIRTRERRQSFENVDPERLRLSQAELPKQPARPQPTPALRAAAALRYGQRWSTEVDGLDASASYLCGEQLVLSTAKLTLALARGTGEVLWSLPNAGTTLMAGRVLLRLLPDGELTLHETVSGSSFAQAQLAPRTGSAGPCLFTAGAGLPPMAILSETRQHLVAIDLRTGQPRFRFRAHGESGSWLARSGRVLLLTSAEGTLDAIDLASGEVVWRFSAGARFSAKSLVWRDVVVAVSGSPNNGPATVRGIELYSGKPLWQRELPAAVHGDPIEAGELVIVPCGRSQKARLHALDPRTGNLRWSAADPGLDHGGCALGLDGTLAINAPSGRAVALGLDGGEQIWTRALANPLTDDVPRQLDPVLRQGALFVPSAQVHVLRPQDGTPLCPIGCDLVPDWLRVDERGWIYVAEESGHIAAFAAAPQLSLVK